MLVSNETFTFHQKINNRVRDLFNKNGITDNKKKNSMLYKQNIPKDYGLLKISCQLLHNSLQMSH